MRTIRKRGEWNGLWVRQNAGLARCAFELHERGIAVWRIAADLQVSEPTVVNLIGYGRRLAAGQPEMVEFPR